MDSEPAEDGAAADLEAISRWLNVNGIYLAAAQGPKHEIHLHIDKLILMSDKSLIGEVRQMIMGDRFDNIGAGSTIINRSMLINSVNRTREIAGDDAANAVERLAKIIDESQNPEATENFKALSLELEQSQPRKALLKSFLNGITIALPAVTEILDLAGHILRVFT